MKENMKKNTERAVIAAMNEMEAAGIPIKEFEPVDDGFYFVFSKGLTPEQQKKAQEIASKYIDAEWSFLA